MITQAAIKHIFTSIIVSVVYALVVVGVGQVARKSALAAPVIVTLAYSVLESIVSSSVWCWVALNHQDSLPTFYTALSGFRMLVALAFLAAVYIVVGRDAMLPYVVVFFLNYVVMLILHSSFYTRQTRALVK